jgi:hypothetical protein
VSEPRPVDGPDSWLDNGGANLRGALVSGSTAIVSLLSDWPVTNPPLQATPAARELLSCQVGEGEAWKGAAVGQTTRGGRFPEAQVIGTSAPEATLVYCRATPNRARWKV